MAAKRTDGGSEPQTEMELVSFTDGRTPINFSIDLSAETVWATQQQIADLFERDKSTISEHIKNILKDRELDEESVVGKFPTTAPDGKVYWVQHYNLDMILSVGYRVSSPKATAFREWATRTLRAYLVDGYVLDERRLRDDPAALQKLAARIRALRADEQNIYAAVRQCFKESASDYDKDSQACRSFYALLQDKFLYAITNSTASQIILKRASHKKPNMGLTSFAGTLPRADEIKPLRIRRHRTKPLGPPEHVDERMGYGDLSRSSAASKPFRAIHARS